jgi:hypothetical protein
MYELKGVQRSGRPRPRALRHLLVLMSPRQAVGPLLRPPDGGMVRTFYQCEMSSEPAVGGSETPVGVEPTSTGLQPVASPSGSSAFRQLKMSSPGVEPGLRPSQSRVRIRHTPRTGVRRIVPAAASSLTISQIANRSDTDVDSSSAPPRSRTSSDSFEDCRASITPTGLVSCATTSRGLEVAKFTPRPASRVSRPGLEPGPGPSEGPMQSTTPSGRKELSVVSHQFSVESGTRHH